MSLPQPKSSLTGSCSAIHNNILYEYTAEAFQSLKLETGATWQTLASGHAVQDAACAGSTPADDSAAGLFVVGGTSSDSAYSGLQKFTYSTGTWETIQPQVSVTQSRIGHSAVYLNGTDSILVYAGSQDGNEHISSQTFTIAATAPYSVLSFDSTLSPPVIRPILMPWSATQAVMVGGANTNVDVMLFDPTTGWVDSGSTLANPITKDISQVKATLMTGTDGSKHMYTFDMTASPNNVERTVLAEAGDAPVTGAAPVSKRALDSSSWPAYNSSLAPTSTRTDYSLATDPNGLVVMAGGDDSEVLCIFDGSKNSWDNATALLGSKVNHINAVPKSTATTATTETPTTTAATKTTGGTTTTDGTETTGATGTTGGTSATTATSATDTSVPTGATSASDAVGAIVATGATGATSASQSSQPSTAIVAGDAASAATASSSSHSPSPTTILGISLGCVFGAAIMLVGLLFLVKRKRQSRAEIEARQAAVMRGDSGSGPYPDDMAEKAGGQYRGHSHQDSSGSLSSVAILMGKAQNPTTERAEGNTRRTSTQGLKGTIGRPQITPIPEQDFVPRNEKVTAFPADVNQPKLRTGPTLNRDGERRSSGWNRYWSGGSTLNMLGFGSGNNGNANAKRETQASESSHYSDPHRMTQDSATVPPLALDLSVPVPPLHPGLNRVNSGSPTVSCYTENVREMSGSIERPISGVSSSGYSSGIPASVNDSWDPAQAKPQWDIGRATSSYYGPAKTDSQYSTGLYPTALGAPGNGRPETGTSQQFNGGGVSSDMSWLNLGGPNQPDH